MLTMELCDNKNNQTEDIGAAGFPERFEVCSSLSHKAAGRSGKSVCDAQSDGSGEYRIHKFAIKNFLIFIKS